MSAWARRSSCLCCKARSHLQVMTAVISPKRKAFTLSNAASHMLSSKSQVPVRFAGSTGSCVATSQQQPWHTPLNLVKPVFADLRNSQETLTDLRPGDRQLDLVQLEKLVLELEQNTSYARVRMSRTAVSPEEDGVTDQNPGARPCHPDSCRAHVLCSRTSCFCPVLRPAVMPFSALAGWLTPTSCRTET